MEKRGFITGGKCKCVIYLVVCIGGSDIKFAHETWHAAKDAWDHFDAFGSVGKAIRKVQGFGVFCQLIEKGGEGFLIAKARIISG